MPADAGPRFTTRGSMPDGQAPNGASRARARGGAIVDPFAPTARPMFPGPPGGRELQEAKLFRILRGLSYCTLFKNSLKLR